MAHAPTFEQFLQKGEPGYTFSLCDISTTTNDLRERVDIIAGKINTVLGAIEENVTTRNKMIDTFVIGKTYARQKKRTTFNAKNSNTWRLDGGINGRWNNTYKGEDYDGLVAICAVTNSMLVRKDEDNDDSELFNNQYYTLAIEQQLIHHFAYTEQDPRLGNTSLNCGKKENKGAKAYVIYIAYKLTEIEE